MVTAWSQCGGDRCGFWIGRDQRIAWIENGVVLFFAMDFYLLGFDGLDFGFQ